MITIFKGDDTGGIFGRRVLLTIESEVSLAGCSCDFVLHGITKRIDAPITPGETYELVYTHEETDTMPLGVSRARVVIVDASGRRSTVSNTHRVLVTDVVADILPESSVSVSLHALQIEDIEGLGDALDGKQKKLTAGQNITIADDGTISASGGGGGGAVDSVNGQTGAVVLTGADIQTSGDDEESLADKVVTLGTELGSHTADVDNPHSVSARQVGAYTSEEVDDRLELKQDALTEGQIAVMDGGPYLPATPSEQVEGSFDVPAGTLQNISASSGDFGDSLSKGGNEVATEEQVEAVSSKVDEIKSTVSTDNRFLVNDTTAAIQTREDEDAEWTNEIRVDKGYDALQGSTMVKLDKSVQTVTVAGGTLTVELPNTVDRTVGDLCLYVNNTSPTATVTMTFPAGVTVYKSKGGDDPKAAAQAGGVTAYYFTEIPGGAWRVMRDELEVAT